jgi:hypothetical protein
VTRVTKNEVFVASPGTNTERNIQLLCELCASEKNLGYSQRRIVTRQVSVKCDPVTERRRSTDHTTNGFEKTGEFAETTLASGARGDGSAEVADNLRLEFAQDVPELISLGR